MKRLLRKGLRHIAQHWIGYGVGLFLLIAAVTCGFLQGSNAELVSLLNAWAVLRILFTEAAFLTGLLLATTHPFGCALSVGLLLAKGYSVGLGIGWWFGVESITHLSTILFLVQSFISLLCALPACCAAAYAALRISPMNKRDFLRLMITFGSIQAIGVLLRCIACAWAV